MPPNSAPASRRAQGPLLVLGIFVFILAIAATAWWSHSPSEGDEARFANLMGSGRTFYDHGDANRAIDVFEQARGMNPANPDVHLNLANAFLLANRPELAATHAGEAAHLEPNNPAAHYVLGCALLRQNQYSNAVQELQLSKDIDRTVNAVSFQLGRAYAGWGRFQDAADQFAEVTQFETNHPSAHYQLGQMLQRLGKPDEAAKEIAAHQAATAGRQTSADNPSVFERCVHTEIRSPASLEQPDRQGIAVRFIDQTASAFGPAAATLHGPLGTLDVNRRGWNDLVAFETNGALRLLWNSNAVFSARADPLAVATAGIPRTLAVGDLNNDRYEDLVVAGDRGTAIVRLATNGALSDVTRISNLATNPAVTVAVADWEFTGKLGLLALTPSGGFRLYRGFGNLAFRDATATSGIPAGLGFVTQITVDDWNNDDLPDVLLTRRGQPPLVLFNQRGGRFSPADPAPDWPAARALATGDLNNDLRTDIALLGDQSIDVYLGGLKEPRRLAARDNHFTGLRFLDYDNDGWLDLVAWGTDGLRVWRNRGRLGFEDTTAALGLGGLGPIAGVLAADFDQDGDIDLILDTGAQGLRFLRNDGANVHGMVKARLLGNRSNASGLGTRIELAAGGWRILRTVQQLPVEIGVGRRTKLDTLTVRWFDTQLPNVEVTVDSRTILNLPELTVPTGSCPYLYAWDGSRNRFVTDLLGASPVGLPVAHGHYIEADPEELVRIGDTRDFVPVDGRYRLQVTEELREILYLDAVRMVVVDHDPGVEVHPTSKLRPERPFPPHELVALRRPRGLRHAETLEGRDVTATLTRSDGDRVSPPQPFGEGYRGLAAPHGVVLDFGPLNPAEPLWLALEGWLRFGGGMANIAASEREDFGFPFPTLEAETADGRWTRVDVVVGAPAGKTKTIIVDLGGRLPTGTRRLRLTTSFEIHWDRIALLEAAGPGTFHQSRLDPVRADLHTRGYSAFADRPWTEPLTPVYERMLPGPNWRITPTGWATRPGDVRELLVARDNGLAIVAGGDELTLEFDAAKIPAPAPGMVREFFLWSVGWDKDADYHVAAGTTIEPLPWDGMDDQRHGMEERPKFPSDVLHERHNTRWIGPKTHVRR